jgi:Ca2+-binding EF-hand superfamily protein
MIYTPYSNTNPKPMQPQMNQATQPLASMRQFIAKSISLHDTDKDGEISLEEALKGPGLTGEKKTTYAPEDAHALWASISGPSGTLSSRDYAQYLLYLDKDGNGQLTEEEVASQKQRLINNTKPDTAKGVVGNYTYLIDIAMQKGLDVELPKGDEQHYALYYASNMAGGNQQPLREIANTSGQTIPMGNTIANMTQPIPSSNAHEITTQNFLNLMVDIGRIGDLSTLPPRTATYQSQGNGGQYSQRTPVRAEASSTPMYEDKSSENNTLQLILLLLMGLYDGQEAETAEG